MKEGEVYKLEFWWSYGRMWSRTTMPNGEQHDHGVVEVPRIVRLNPDGSVTVKNLEDDHDEPT